MWGCVSRSSDSRWATKTSVFRATNYASGSVDPTNASHIVVNYGSYISRNSNESTGCAPASFSATTGFNLYTGAGTQACNNQILQSDSWNGAASFDGTTADARTMPVVGNQRSVADEFWQWTGITSSGTTVVGYYDRQYGNDNVSGSSDYSVAVGDHSSRVSTVSSPPPTEFGGLFNGDYNVLAVSGRTAYVTWTDTRNPGITSCPGNPDAICALGNDEDDFMAKVHADGGQDH